MCIWERETSSELSASLIWIYCETFLFIFFVCSFWYSVNFAKVWILVNWLHPLFGKIKKKTESSKILQLINYKLILIEFRKICLFWFWQILFVSRFSLQTFKGLLFCLSVSLDLDKASKHSINLIEIQVVETRNQ